MTWVKTFPDGTTAWGDRIDGPDFTLTDESDIPVDGWRWVPNYDPDPPADDPLAAVIALLGQVTPDQLARVLALGVAVTEPESVDRLTTAVETGDLADGVAVVADGEKVAVVDLASVVAEQVAAATAGAKAADVARAIVRPLEALTGGSTSTATRSALLAIRDELDKLIDG